MHELSIAVSIVEVASEEAQRHGGGAVAAVHIKLGPLSGLVKEALVGAFELARVESPLAEAQLVVEETPLVLYCEACQADKPATSLRSFTCSTCGAPSAKVVSGREMQITALELEEE